MTSWRDSASSQARAELDALLNAALGLCPAATRATRRVLPLRRSGDRCGQIEMIAARPDMTDDGPLSADVITASSRNSPPDKASCLPVRSFPTSTRPTEPDVMDVASNTSKDRHCASSCPMRSHASTTTSTTDSCARQRPLGASGRTLERVRSRRAGAPMLSWLPSAPTTPGGRGRLYGRSRLGRLQLAEPLHGVGRDILVVQQIEHRYDPVTCLGHIAESGHDQRARFPLPNIHRDRQQVVQHRFVCHPFKRIADRPPQPPGWRFWKQ